jgi:hypothetical protein
MALGAASVIHRLRVAEQVKVCVIVGLVVGHNDKAK